MEYIVDFNPIVISDIDYDYLSKIEKKVKDKKNISKKELMDFLDTIISITREKIVSSENGFDNKCDLAQSILFYYFNNLNCNIFPCMTQNIITNDIVGHSFLVVQLLVDNELRNYLLDPTYIQFFRKENCKSEKYFISPKYPDIILLTPHPGYFIKDEQIEYAKELLNHGYMELNEKCARMYGDSFYNTKTGGSARGLSYQTIPGNIYIKAFLSGHEPLSKSEEELIHNNLVITPFSLQIDNIEKHY